MTKAERMYLDVLYTEFMQKSKDLSTAGDGNEAATMRTLAFLTQKIKLDFELMGRETIDEQTTS